MALRANALTTLARLKSHLNIKADDLTQDSRLELFIDAASERIERYTDRLLKSQGTLTELQHGRGSNILLLKQYPIIAVSELRIDAEHVFTAADTLIPATDYGITDDGNGLASYTTSFPSGYNNIQVKYTAGYTTVPSDLELACLWYAEWMYLHRTRGDMGRTSISKGDESIGVLDAAPKMIMEILNDYKRTEFPLLNAPIRNY